MTTPRPQAHCVVALLSCLAAGQVCAQNGGPLTRLFDTVTPSDGPMPGEAVTSRTGWRLIPPGNVDHPFTGDAVLLNNRIAVVLRHGADRAEVYSRIADGATLRATLGHARTRSGAADVLKAFGIVENAPSAVALAATLHGDDSARLGVRLTVGEAIIEIQPEVAGRFAEVRSQARYVVVPDYFGDDVVYPTDARSSLFLPAENLCMNLVDGGESIVMCVWEAPEQDAWLSAAGAGPEWGHCSLRISSCAMGKKVWLAVLESPGIWHSAQTDIEAEWTPPFPAKWRQSLARPGGAVGSWDLERGADREQSRSKDAEPCVVYPIDRSRATPLTVSCPTDVMRSTLGVGPCQYILAVEGLTSEDDAAPANVMAWIEKQFERKRDRRAADAIEERLGQMVRHIGRAQARIGRYAESAEQLRTALGSDAGPDELAAILDDLDAHVARGLPAAPRQQARRLADRTLALIGQENALAACQPLGEQIRAIDSAQSRALAGCRMAIRRLRQAARTIGTRQPRVNRRTAELQRLAEDVLRRH